MLRGSRPGERRGGRKRDTPNRRTILTNTILSIGLDKPTASWRAFLLKLVKDQKLPADTRMAVMPKCFPAKRTRSSRTGRSQPLAGIWTNIPQEASDKVNSGLAFTGSQMPATVPAGRDWNPQALDALFGVVQDATADPKARRRAARTIAEFLLPKVGKKAKTLPDEYGFSVNPNLASAYRDIQLELRALNKSTREIPAIAQKIKKLEARSDKVRRRLQVACPKIYGNAEAANDYVRLMEFTAFTCASPRAGRSAARSAMSSPSPCAVAIIAKCIAMVMKRLGGTEPLSIRSHVPVRCGWRRILC